MAHRPVLAYHTFLSPLIPSCAALHLLTTLALLALDNVKKLFVHDLTSNHGRLFLRMFEFHNSQQVPNPPRPTHISGLLHVLFEGQPLDNHTLSRAIIMRCGNVDLCPYLTGRRFRLRVARYGPALSGTL
jgi:hypothetical protein